MKPLENLFSQLELEKEVNYNDFKKAFVHISLYETVPNNKNYGNSRFVFIGMYAFKGVLANLISKYIAGNGKQLQQYLGNVFANDNLAKIYDNLKLKDLAQTHESLNKDNYKHIFTFAFLGFIYENCNAGYVEEFANKHFLHNSDHLLPKVVVVNPIQILKAKAEAVLNEKTKILNFEKESLKYTQVLLTSGAVIGEHASVSGTYAKKKAIKLATIYFLNIEAQQPQYQKMIERQKIAQKVSIEHEKAAIKKKHEA